MSNCQAIHEKKKKQTIGIAIAFLLITGTFGIIFYINTDALLTIDIPISFVLRNNNIDMAAIDLNTFTFYNTTIWAEQLDVNAFMVILDSELYLKNYSETLKSILDTQRNNTGTYVPTSLTYMITSKGGYTVNNFNDKSTSVKVPKGTGIFAMIMIISIDIPNIAATTLFFIGIIPDIDNASKVLGFEHVELTINSLVYKSEYFPAFYDYMANRTEELPVNYPYQIEFSITRNMLGYTDFIARGY